MGIVYRVDQSLGTALVLWDGTINAQEFLSHVRNLTADQNWPPHTKRHLSDLRTAIVDDSIDDEVLKAAAELFGRHPKIATLRAAIVAAESYVKAGVFERLITPYRPFVFVFNTLRPACMWLGIDAAQTEGSLRSLRTDHGAH